MVAYSLRSSEDWTKMSMSLSVNAMGRPRSPSPVQSDGNKRLCVMPMAQQVATGPKATEFPVPSQTTSFEPPVSFGTEDSFLWVSGTF